MKNVPISSGTNQLTKHVELDNQMAKVGQRGGAALKLGVGQGANEKVRTEYGGIDRDGP